MVSPTLNLVHVLTDGTTQAPKTWEDRVDWLWGVRGPESGRGCPSQARLQSALTYSLAHIPSAFLPG